VVDDESTERFVGVPEKETLVDPIEECV